VGQPVIIDNKAGAAGIIGTEATAKASPDGYTIMLVVPAHVINSFLYKKLPYDPIKDFAPVVLAAELPQVLMVHPSIPAKSAKELIALANSKPEGLSYASGGSGTATHLAAELFKSMTGAKLVHIPYKGAGPAMTDLLGGQVAMAFVALPVALPYAESGRLRALGVTSAKRSSAAPDLPTIAESGVPGYEAPTWTGIVAPAGTPQEVIGKLNKEIVEILQKPDVQSRLAQQGFQPVGGTPEQFATYLQAEMAKWGKVVKASGARVE
jgi:tripartite-type tricarboxylate transporter receptor subunit TctC